VSFWVEPFMAEQHECPDGVRRASAMPDCPTSHAAGRHPLSPRRALRAKDESAPSEVLVDDGPAGTLALKRSPRWSIAEFDDEVLDAKPPKPRFPKPDRAPLESSPKRGDRLRRGVPCHQASPCGNRLPRRGYFAAAHCRGAAATAASTLGVREQDRSPWTQATCAAQGAGQLHAQLPEPLSRYGAPHSREPY